MHGLSMASADLVDEVLARMAALDVSQSTLARETGMSQPHLSRVLGKQLKPGKKTRSRLEKWMAGSPSHGAENHPSSATAADVGRLIRKLSGGSPQRRMHVMQMLRAIEAIVGEN